jgi:putative nicotinate phosphoribosyltransferase
LLVDTYNVLKSGIPNAIKAFNEEVLPRGFRPKGIRIDSGDITYLSKKARKLLDEAGFPDCKIVASNSLDEFIIRDMILQGAQVDSFGVGERLITAASNPVFGGVYKIVAENQHTQDRSVEKFVSGCLPIQKIVQLTSAEMQTAFNSGSIPTKDFMSRFTMAPKINVVGMEEGEPQVTSVGEVFNRIGSGLWTSVVVCDVKYAVDNRVNSFTISVTY